jgi:hypothetical protein
MGIGRVILGLLARLVEGLGFEVTVGACLYYSIPCILLRLGIH